MNAANPLLEIHGLECWRGDRRLFHSLKLSLNVGDALQIVGPNGSGKTTLLRAICGLNLPEQGELRWRGEQVGPRPARFRSEIVYVGHENGLKFELSAEENLNALRGLAGRPRSIAPAQALEQLGLRDFAKRPIRTLSSGQRRRVALARLVIVEAALWLLDEPFTALDDAGMRIINRLIDAHLEAGGALLFTSHSPVALTLGAPRKLDLGR